MLLLMFRKLKNIQKNDINIVLGVKSTKLVQPSLMQEFQTVKVNYFVGDEKKEAVAVVDDIYMLFNQQRLAHMGADTINAWLNTLTPRSDALAQLRKKCSDEQLMELCKSRYIQSPSELLAWSEYLNSNYADIVGEMQAAVQQQQEAAQQQQEAAQQSSSLSQ